MLETSILGNLRVRLSAVHGNHKRVAQGAALIALLTVVAKIASAAREMAIASRYGVSGTLDAYQMALTVTTMVPAILGAIATAVLVPTLIAARARSSERLHFINELNGAVVLISIVIALLTWAAAPYASALLAGTTYSARLQLTVRMSSALAPVAAFTIGIAYLSARLQSRERYAYSVSEAVPALAIMALVLLPFGAGESWPLIVGTIAGLFLQLLLLGGLASKGDAPLGSVRLTQRSPEWRSLYGSLLVMGVGQLLLAASTPIDQGFAARLGEGAVATLGYANRIIALLTGFGTIVVARALLPVLAGSVAEGKVALARRQAWQWAMLTGTAAVAIAIVVWFAAPTIIRLLFQRGAFDASATAQVSRVLQFGTLQLPFYFAGMAVVQFIIALRGYRAILAITAAAICAKLLLNLLLVPMMGLPGIVAATAGMYAVSLFGQYLYTRAVV